MKNFFITISSFYIFVKTVTFATAYSLQCDKLISIFSISFKFIPIIFKDGLPCLSSTTSISFQHIAYLSSSFQDNALKAASLAANLAA